MTAWLDCLPRTGSGALFCSHVDASQSCSPTFRNVGTAQVILRKASDKEKIEKLVNDTIVEFANRGYRSLGVAKAEGDSVGFPFMACIC